MATLLAPCRYPADPRRNSITAILHNHFPIPFHQALSLTPQIPHPQTAPG